MLSLTGLKGQNHEIFNTFLPKNSTLARYEQANYFSPNLSYLRRYSRKTCQPIRIHASRESWMKWNLDKDTRCWSKIEQMFLEPISFCDFGAFFHVGDIAQLAFFYVFMDYCSCQRGLNKCKQIIQLKTSFPVYGVEQQYPKLGTNRKLRAVQVTSLAWMMLGVYWPGGVVGNQ